MSDSEDESAFASADEGDSQPSPTQQGAKKDEKKPEKGVKKGKAAQSQKASGDDSSPKKKPSPVVSSGNQKEKGKQQQAAESHQKKKGKNTGPQQQSTSKSKESVKISPERSSEKSDSFEGDVKKKMEEVKEKEKEQAQESRVASTDIDASGKKSTLPKAERTPKKSPAKEEEEEKRAELNKETTTASANSPESQNIARNITENVGDQKQKETPGESASPEKPSSGWGWGGWGSSILSAATTSVQTFTDQLGDGLTTIIDSVESSLGVPDPAELAKSNKESEEETSTDEKQVPVMVEQPSSTPDISQGDKKEVKEESDQKKQDEDVAKSESQSSKGGGGGWFSSWGVADIAKKVQNTGKSLATKGQTLMTEGFDAVENLASGGIDVLENIGKKTYNTLSEHDPAFKKTREYLKARNNKPNLSSMLKEAKEQAERDAVEEKETEESRKAHFETQFDEYQGIAHLEALEMLSNQCEKKVHTLLNSMSSDDLKSIKPVLISIKEVFEVEDEEDVADDGNEQDFSSLVNKYVSELELGTGPDKLNKVHEMVKQWVMDFDSHESNDKDAPKVIHQQAIQSLAELTSKGVEQFHKAGELVLMQKESERDCKERAHSFARLTGVLCHEIRNLATKFTECLHKAAASQGEDGDITALATNVYLEATNSSTYIQDAFQLLLPILQQAAIEQTILSRQS